MNIREKTWEELKELDLSYVRNILSSIENDIEYDEWFGGWCIGERPISEYLFEEETLYLNPKELEGYIEEIIEDEMKIKR